MMIPSFCIYFLFLLIYIMTWLKGKQDEEEKQGLVVINFFPRAMFYSRNKTDNFHAKPSWETFLIPLIDVSYQIKLFLSRISFYNYKNILTTIFFAGCFFFQIVFSDVEPRPTQVYKNVTKTITIIPFICELCGIISRV